MAREVRVTLGGKERVLRYRTTRDRMEIEKIFHPKRMEQVLNEDVLGEKKNGLHDTSIEAIATFLWIGARHEAPSKITLETALDWIDAHMASGGTMSGIIGPIYDAVLLSGALGVSFDMEELKKKLAKDVAEDAPATAAVPPSGAESKESGASSIETSSNSTTS